jgi:hypothetical protein
MHHHPRSAMRTSVALLPAMRLHIVPKTSINIDKLCFSSDQTLNFIIRQQKKEHFWICLQTGINVYKDTHFFINLCKL